jgi:formiminotetrahydrofolate cyclodeaminase
LPRAKCHKRAKRNALNGRLRYSLHFAPLQTCPSKSCVYARGGLKLGHTVAVHGARAAAADVQMGVALLHAAFDGAQTNLEGN